MRRTMTRSRMALLIVLFLALPATAYGQDKAEKAHAHYDQAENYMKAEVYDLAIKEYRKGYKLMPEAHGFLFNIALAYQKWGRKDKALAAFEKYLERDPEGKKAAEARARAVALKRAIEAEEKEAEDRKREQDEGDSGKEEEEEGREDRVADRTGDILNEDELRDDEVAEPRAGRSWGMIALGAAIIAAGVAADLSPDTSSNGSVDALDFLPVGLYGVGALLVYRGAF